MAKDGSQGAPVKGLVLPSIPNMGLTLREEIQRLEDAAWNKQRSVQRPSRVKQSSARGPEQVETSAGDRQKISQTPDRRRKMSKPSLLHAQSRKTRIDTSEEISSLSRHPQEGDQESWNAWGFEDTKYHLYPGQTDPIVEISGTRYASSSQKLESLLPWISKVMNVKIPAKEQALQYPPMLPEPIINNAFVDEIESLLQGLAQISRDGEQRLRHGHGHTQEEMYVINYGGLGEGWRIPDIVVFPQTVGEVEKIVRAASKHNVCLIPYGGGTNVSQALRCPSGETRMIASVDMMLLSRVRWIEPINRTACIEAGAVGRDVESILAVHGFTIGHEPDSVEFSTLGGWIATKASGMKKNKYGNIEDAVLDIEAVTPAGMLTRSDIVPRESVGSNPRSWLFGSEGNVGIITAAVVKLHSLPKIQRYGSVLFRSFEDGAQFMHELSQETSPPASVRLVDNLQFQFSQALKPAARGSHACKSKIEKVFVTKIRGFDPQKMVACTLVFEGTDQEVQQQESVVYEIAKRNGGMKAGAENGRRGYEMTFAIAYIRDFAMGLHIVAESFETSCPWSLTVYLCDRVKQRVHEEHAHRMLPGRPFITCRISQLYETGATIYFYLALFLEGIENPSQVYTEIEDTARDEILMCGGSLSHHHGVGKIRQKWLRRVVKDATLDLNRQIKQAMDPKNIFGCGNMLPAN